MKDPLVSREFGPVTRLPDSKVSAVIIPQAGIWLSPKSVRYGAL